MPLSTQLGIHKTSFVLLYTQLRTCKHYLCHTYNWGTFITYPPYSAFIRVKISLILLFITLRGKMAFYQTMEGCGYPVHAHPQSFQNV